ncbi:MAG: MFS transporter [Dysgonamonadaceae bacterium]|jgi:MFS family permease|nr:MFS transporter [Dysgonamonadaceae bacterium]
MNKNLVFIAACAGLAFFGITMLALGPILSHLGEGSNALPSTLSIGIIIGTVVFGPIVDRFGYKWMLIIGALLALTGIQGLANFNRISILHLSMAMLGIGGGILNGETNALVASLYDDKKRGMRLSILGAFYCIGALLWTLLNYFSPEDYILPLNITSAIMALFIVFFILIRFPDAHPQESIPLKTSLKLLKYPALLLFALLLFFQSGFEGASGNFTVKYIENFLEVNSETATLTLTMMTVGMLIGRIFLGSIMKRLGNSITLYIYLIVALSGVALLCYSTNILAAYAAMALVGLGVGVTYPVVFNYLGAIFKKQSGTAFSIAIFLAFWGQFVFNKAVGLFFDDGQYGYFPYILALAVVGMLFVMPFAKRAIRHK